jgi:hypothetical protein
LQERSKRRAHCPENQGWGRPEMLKLSLVAMFVLSLATLSAAASSLPL